MKSRIYPGVISLRALLGVSLLATPLHAAESGSGPQSLLNGKDLAGWQVADSNPFWKVESGVLVGENDENLKGNVLHTDKAYKDFVLELEVRWSGEIDSGVMLRKPELQVQFGISRSLKTDMTGSFYTGGAAKYPEAGQAKEISKVFKPDDWNTVRIEAKGDTFTVWFNGTQVSQYTDTKYAEAAPIGLQVHPGLKMKVEFRNIRIQTFD